MKRYVQRYLSLYYGVCAVLCAILNVMSADTYPCISVPYFMRYSEHVSNIPRDINRYPTAFPYGNGMVLHFYQQQESSTTKTVHKVINNRLKTYV